MSPGYMLLVVSVIATMTISILSNVSSWGDLFAAILAFLAVGAIFLLLSLFVSDGPHEF
jgi:uncharacterized membrane protein